MDYELKGQVWKALDDNRVSIMRSANAEIGSYGWGNYTREKFWDQFGKVMIASQQSSGIPSSWAYRLYKTTRRSEVIFEDLR